MPRGTTPHQPAKTGRQEGTCKVPSSKKPGVLGTPRTGEGARPHTVRAGAQARGKTYNPIAPDRIDEILKRLDTLYADVTCALHHKSAWELLVATILSAQSTDVRVNMVTPELFRKYPTVQDFAALKPEQLEPDVRSTGFFRNKSKSVVGAAKMIVNDFGGEVPEQMDQLLTIPGVARKTANVVLGTWFKKNEGVVVDTHVHRISRRLELTRNDDPKTIEQDLMKSTDQPASADVKLSDFLCFAVYSANLAFGKAYKPILEELGLTYTQYITIIALWEEDNQTVSSLGEKLFLESNTLTPILKKLEAAGYVERQRDPEDERQVRVGLTKSGRRLREKGLNMDLVEATGLAPDEFSKVQKAIVTLRNNLVKAVQNGE